MATVEELISGIEQNDDKAMCEYAYMLYTGDDIEKDVSKAHTLFVQAAEKGNTDAMFWLGVICEKEEDFLSPKEGFEWFLKAAKAGSLPAQFQVGYHYLHGVNVEQDYTEACRWFTVSAAKGYPLSQNSLGTMYLRGQVGFEGTVGSGDEEADSEEERKKNLATGWKWLMRSAAQRHPSGLYNLAGMYLYGVHVDKDVDIAVSMYRLAHLLGGTGTRAIDILNSIGFPPEFTEEDDERLDGLFMDFVNGDHMQDDRSMGDMIHIVTTNVSPRA